MATRFCGNCGTEVDDDAAFCPSCGRPIAPPDHDDQAAAIPAAPVWPEPANNAQPMTSEPASPEAPGFSPTSEAVSGEPPPVYDAPAVSEPQAAADAARSELPPPQRAAPPPAGPPPGGVHPSLPGERSSAPQVELPITWPVTLSGWLIGGGAFAAAIGFIADLFAFGGAGNAVSVIFVLLMLGIAATVFISASMPAIPHLRLATLCVVFVAVGVAVDRLGFNVAGFGTVLVLLGAGAAAAGAVILELGRDQPMAGPTDRR